MGRHKLQTPSARHQTVIDAIGAGQTLKAAGALIGVTAKGAQWIAKRWGVARRYQTRYTPEEDIRALELYDAGMPIRHIACTMKRGGARHALERLGAHRGQKRKSVCVPWTDKDVAILKRMRPKKSYRAIAEKLGRSIGGVLRKAHSLGLCAPIGYIDERDERGWHIPGPGTTARRIYDLMVAGIGPTQISRTLGISLGHAASTTSRIRDRRTQWRWERLDRERRQARRKREAANA